MEKAPITAPIRVHVDFVSQGEAYDVSQTDDSVRDGDILITEAGTPAIMVEAWPTMIDVALNRDIEEDSAFHVLGDPEASWYTAFDGRYGPSYLAWIRWNFAQQYGDDQYAIQLLNQEPSFEVWGDKHRATEANLRLAAYQALEAGLSPEDVKSEVFAETMRLTMELESPGE